MVTRYLYVMGSKSGVGKSTVCQGILAQWLVEGRSPDRIAYIKPVTQCTQKQSVALFCEHHGIACADVGELVFKTGFTRKFIDGLTEGESELMSRVLAGITRIGEGRALVVIDGIGDPAVGSIVGVSNAAVARVLRCPVLFVGKAGFGSAIDDTVLCVSFLQSHDIERIGLVYNQCRVNMAGIERYFSKRLTQLLPGVRLFGFLGRDEGLDLRRTGHGKDYIADWFGRGVDGTALIEGWIGLAGNPSFPPVR